MTTVEFQIYDRDNNLILEVVLNDNLYDYLSQTFLWIRSEWVDGNAYQGLDSIGPSIISDRQEIKKMQGLIDAWLNLFKWAPALIDIPDGINIVNGFSIGDQMEKMLVVDQLTDLDGLLRQALEINVSVHVQGI